jgi:hypothetical protein
MVAYYLAEAGLEDALLQYRFNRDIEISDKATDYACKDITTPPPAEPTGTIMSECGTDPQKRQYSVTITSRKDSLANQLVAKDNIYEIRLQSGDNITISWTNNSPPTVSSPNKMMVEFSLFSYNIATGSVELIDKKLVDPSFSVPSSSYTTSGSGTRLVRVKPWYVKDDGKGGYAEGDALSPIPMIKLNISGNFSSSIASITSTGYYGGVIRKITADMDKSSGSIINLLDYTIYSGSKLYK